MLSEYGGHRSQMFLERLCEQGLVLTSHELLFIYLFHANRVEP